MRNRTVAIRKALVCAAFAFAVLMIPAVASADNVACYDWDCNPSQTQQNHFVCDFDSGCTELDGALWKYRWDFGDGSSIVLTGSETIQHDYDCTSTCSASPEVELTVIPLSDDSFSVECEILVYNPTGPPLPTIGTCPP